MQAKSLHILHIYIDAHSRENDFLRLHLYCTPEGAHLLRQHTFATFY